MKEKIFFEANNNYYIIEITKYYHDISCPEGKEVFDIDYNLYESTEDGLVNIPYNSIMIPEPVINKIFGGI